MSVTENPPCRVVPRGRCLVRLGAVWVIALAIACGLGAAPAAADSVTVRGGVHDNYGRIAFNWPAPVRYEAAIDNGRLFITFGRPIQADYAQVLSTLDRYLRTATPGADGRSVSFRLTGDFSLRAFDMGSTIAVDLIENEATRGLQPPQAEPAPRAAERREAPSPRASTPAASGPQVTVRTGIHDTYTRLVFDWPSRVDYTIERDGGRVTVRFARPGDLQLGRLATRPPRWVSDVRDAGDGERAAIVFSVPATSALKDFHAGPKMVLDVQAPGTADVAIAEKRAPKPAPKPEPKPEPQPAPEPEPKPAPEPAPEPEAAAQPEPAPAPKPQPAAPAASEQEPESRPEARTEVAMDARNGITMRFHFDEPVGAAMFKRAGYVWVVFDAETPVDTDALARAATGFVSSIEEVAAEHATVLRMKVASNIGVHPARDGLAWIAVLNDKEMAPQTVVDTKAQTSASSGPRLYMPVNEAGLVVPVHDPEVGDNLVVTPVIPLGHGVPERRVYPDLTVLPSVQGIVVRPQSEGLRVRSFGGGVEVTGSLNINAVDAKTEAVAKMAPARPVNRIFNLDKWARGPGETFTESRQALEHDIAKARDALRNQARLDLARFYFANGLGHEANGVMTIIAEDSPDEAAKPEFRALRGGARYLMGRYDEAREDFSHASLMAVDEAEFWRAAIGAQTGQAAESAATLRKTGTVLRPYPPVIKMPLGLLSVEAALAAGDVRMANHYLDTLEMEEPTEAQNDYIAFLKGETAYVAGDFEAAVVHYEEAMNGRHRPARARAARNRAEMLLEQDKITRPEAIEELEKLRFAWRGDRFEFDLLRRLGRLYIDDGDYRSGLRTLRQAATHFRQYDEASQVTEEMAQAFENLYLKNGADTLPPVTAIALFDEFKELTPSGEKGDEMIRKLADRLIGVDLLDRAAELLENQVQYRLSGAQKARVGAKLAMVYMRDGKLDKALSTLGRTEISGVSDDLATLRRHLKARTLMELGENQRALDVLDGDTSRAADLLRAEQYWQSQQWNEAARVLDRLVEGAGARPGQPLEPDQAKRVLNLAVALTLSGNERGLNKVRRDYGQAMLQGPYRDAFQLIASPSAQGMIDYRTISSRVAEVESFQSFLAANRERLADEERAIN